MSATATIATPYIVTIRQVRAEFATLLAAIAFIEAEGASIAADEKETAPKHLEAGHSLDFAVANREFAKLYDARAQVWPYMQEHGYVEVSDAQKSKLGNAVRELSAVLGTTMYHCSAGDADNNYATVKAAEELLNGLLIESGLVNTVPAGQSIRCRPVVIDPAGFLNAISMALNALRFMRIVYKRFHEHNTRVLESADLLLAEFRKLPA